MKPKTLLYYYLCLSSLTILLLILIMVFHRFHQLAFQDKIIVGSFLIGSCILGISLAFYPGWFKRCFTKNHDSSVGSSQKKNISFRGHHPNCSEFVSHTITIGKRKYCAGCLGLSIGALLALLLIVSYLSFFQIQSIIIIQVMFLLGIVFLYGSYLETIYHMKNPIYHMISNILLVFSFILLCISILEITGNSIYGLLTILLSFLLLTTRIQLSQWKHTEICRSCEKHCKQY